MTQGDCAERIFNYAVEVTRHVLGIGRGKTPDELKTAIIMDMTMLVHAENARYVKWLTDKGYGTLAEEMRVAFYTKRAASQPRDINGNIVGKVEVID